jgi:hypothetical protein
MTLTAKIRLLPTEKQIKLLKETSDAYKQGCNYVVKGKPHSIMGDTLKTKEPNTKGCASNSKRDRLLLQEKD